MITWMDVQGELFKSSVILFNCFIFAAPLKLDWFLHLAMPTHFFFFFFSHLQLGRESRHHFLVVEVLILNHHKNKGPCINLTSDQKNSSANELLKCSLSMCIYIYICYPLQNLLLNPKTLFSRETLLFHKCVFTQRFVFKEKNLKILKMPTPFLK